MATNATFYNIDGTKSDAVYSAAGEGLLCWANELPRIFQEAIKTLVVDHRTWYRFDLSDNYLISRALPNLKEIVFVVAEIDQLESFDGHYQFVALRPGGYVDSGSGLIDVDDETGANEYQTWEDRQEDIQELFKCFATEPDHQLYDAMKNDPRISIPKIALVGIKRADKLAGCASENAEESTEESESDGEESDSYEDDYFDYYGEESEDDGEGSEDDGEEGN